SSATRPAWSTPCSTRSPASCGAASSTRRAADVSLFVNISHCDAASLRRRFGLDVGLPCQLAVTLRSGGAEKTLLLPLICRRGHAGDIALACERLAGLEQAEPPPRFGHALAPVPDAVAVHVDERVLLVARLES